MLVNNAGIGVIGAFEATPMATAREVFETNTFGVMAMTQAVLPQFRARRSGVVVNVTSSVTLAPMPLVAVYTASKMAIEGFTASLAHELAGLRRARQAGRARLRPDHALHAATRTPASKMRYPRRTAIRGTILAAFAQPAAVTTEADVAEAVWRAANDSSGQLRFPAGPDAVALVQSR